MFAVQHLNKSKLNTLINLAKAVAIKIFKSILHAVAIKCLQVAFEHKLHVNVLEQLIAQYEPDAAQYINAVQQVYDNVNENYLFDLLR